MAWRTYDCPKCKNNVFGCSSSLERIGDKLRCPNCKEELLVKGHTTILEVVSVSPSLSGVKSVEKDAKESVK